ncbi:MAG: cytochrome c [Cytophagales bacterium]|jgi:mono/diheme cytochrome c family protein|nr:cytochrome c [Cytophagales bacterium]MCA6389302.1 cytochrome c [Cytophagales bacterium]MCA6392757.1 cytochrome c [Cytophagales bacterium]MCA6394730.1 cytochrome c [Cytophagales bacterium]MCA6398073.1 cytochrome c [Cytophagales bacterium]
MKKGILFFVFSLLIIAFSSFQKKSPFDLKASISRGQEIYNINCIACHMEKGEGLEGVYPPLAKSDYLMADKKRSIIQILKGVTGPMKVNGVDYDGEMNAFELSDSEVSDVLNYVRNSFGNKGVAVLPAEVLAARK